MFSSAMVFRRPLLNAALAVVVLSPSFQLSSVFPFVSAFSSSSALPPHQKQPLPKNLPRSPDDVVRQAANSITKAYECGIYLQTIRLPLSEAIYGDKEEGFVADRAIGWQGGPSETYRYLSPMVSNLLPRISTSSNTAGLAIKVTEYLRYRSIHRKGETDQFIEMLV